MDLETCVLGHWKHSYEDDTADVRVYRPADYRFPRSRGRTGFEFRAGGELVYYGIGRADGPEQFPGRWVIEAPDRIRVDVESDRIRPFVLEVVSCDAGALKVRR